MSRVDPEALQQVDFIHLKFKLEFQDAFVVELPTVLQLRRELKRVSQLLGDDSKVASIKPLLGGMAPSDPVVRRHMSKTPPPFVIQPTGTLPLAVEAGDVFELPILFWGQGRQYVSLFAQLLRTLGPLGIYCGDGEYVLAGITAVSLTGEEQDIWVEGQAGWSEPEWSLHTFEATHVSVNEKTRLQFTAPARLMKKGKPLFRPTLKDVFPYILRRVSSVCHAWSGVEIVKDPGGLLQELAQTGQGERLVWQDWRELDAPGGTLALGGVVGSLDVSPDYLELAGDLFRLGELLNLGKNAAYGAGAWRLS